jgi:hypothetical protein
MAKQERLEIIKQLQECRKSKVILFVLGDRQPVQIFGTIIATDSIQLLQKILKAEGRANRISLVVHSTGGDLNAPWPIVNLLREFSDDFEVIVPRRALSAATLICLGSERIVMSPFSHLSPVDPHGQYPTPEGKTEQIAIEDIIGFIEFSQKKIGLKDRAGKIEILKALEKTDAKVLGSINRTHSLIRKLTAGLLELRKTNRLSDDEIKKIVINLTEKTYSHSHLIGRIEARKDIGLGPMIEFADEDTYRVMELLYDQIDSDLDLSKSFDIQEELAKTAPNQATISAVRCIIQSEKLNFEGKSNVIILANGQIPRPSFKWVLD